MLESLELLYGEPDADFDRLTRIAARVFGAKFALLPLLDAERQWFRSCFGVDDLQGSEVEASFCAYTLAEPGSEPLIVLDTAADPRFENNRFVVGSPKVRFYAGAPVVVRGQRLGSLCVLDTQPRSEVDPDQLAQLVDLAGVVSSLLSLKDEARVRARTAAALIREEWRHALTLEAGKVGSWVWDVPSGEITCNDTFRRMYGLPDNEAIDAQQVLDALHANDQERLREEIKGSLEEGADFNVEARSADATRWLAMRGRVYQRDADGRPLVLMGASTDISENKLSADNTRLLLRELNHRVKNTLAMIQSVARQTIRQNPDPQSFIEAFSGRLKTISDAHVLLANRDWSGVTMYEVIGSQFGPHFLEEPDRAKVEGENIMLPADHALGLGLILHELTTNTHRYGAWASENGVVDIVWEITDTPVRGLSLNWRERGGPRVSTPTEYGLGARLIERSLAKVLDSKVDLKFNPAGVEASIWMPLPEEV
ncbi:MULTISPECIES: HWE histidine kinase domain-containing protein [unclassified Devosia]|uniref:HWE histidine kinase domain-containing protein n=1 Tax=unclassified Devosia TaxID=196773 RepID=UPI0015577780